MSENGLGKKKFLVAICILLLACNAFGFAVDNLLGFSGKLKDSSGIAVQGTKDFNFFLYNAVTAGSILFHEGETALDVNAGIWSATVGDGNTALSSVNFDQNIWLEILVEGETMTPRKKLTPTSSAFIAKSASGASITDTNWATESKDFKELSDLNDIYDGRYSTGVDTNWATESKDFQELSALWAFFPYKTVGDANISSAAAWNAKLDLADVWAYVPYKTIGDANISDVAWGKITGVPHLASETDIDGNIDAFTYGSADFNTIYKNTAISDTNWATESKDFKELSDLNSILDGRYYPQIDLNATTAGHTAGSELIGVATMGSATHSMLGDVLDLINSSGRVSGGTVTDAGGETIDVNGGTGFIKATDDDIAEILSFNWDTNAGISIPTDTIRYVGISYNSGTPTVVLKTSEFDFDLDTEFPLGTITNEAGTIHILNNYWWITDGTSNIIERLGADGHVVRDKEFGGLVTSVPGTRNVAVTAGRLWSRLNKFSISAVDTSVASTVQTYWVNSSGAWTDANISQYSVTEWNDTTLDALQTISNNQYANWWVYAEADDLNIAMIYPQATYSTSALAEAESPPTTLPSHISENGILIGRIVFKEGTDAPVEVQTAFETTFNPAQAATHNNLGGLDGGEIGYYGHTTAAEYTNIQGFNWVQDSNIPDSSCDANTSCNLSGDINTLIDANFVNVQATNFYGGGEALTGVVAETNWTVLNTVIPWADANIVSATNWDSFCDENNSCTITGGINTAIDANTADLNITGTMLIGSQGVTTDYDVNFWGVYDLLSNSEDARLFWDASKGALRAGTDGTTISWTDANTGSYSTAFGYGAEASGTASTSAGWVTHATGDYSTAFGLSTRAGGENSVAMGSNSIASGDDSFAFGPNNNAIGFASVAAGSSTDANGNYATTFGIGTVAQAYSSFALGRYNLISGTTNSWVSSEPLFIIGNGATSGTPANALTVLKDGNTGIGVTTPKNALNVLGDINATGKFYGGGANLNGDFNVGNGSTSMVSITPDANRICFGPDCKFWIDSNGEALVFGSG